MLRRAVRLCALGLAAAMTPSLTRDADAGDWPSFRGAHGDGVAITETPPRRWGPTSNIRWRTRLAGTGNGSPIVVSGRVMLTCATNFGQLRTLHCFRSSDGTELWSRPVALETIELTHKSNPYCGTTPVSDGELVVVWHGTAGMHCYTIEGEHVWSCHLGEIRHLWGYATSPVIYEDRVILHSGANRSIFMAAVRLSDGQLLWKTEEPGGKSNDTPDGELTGSWCTPIVVREGLEDLLVCGMPTRVVAYAPRTGEIRWTCDGLAGRNGNLVYASPLAGQGLVVVMGGYMAPTLGVRLGGDGNVTETHRLWVTSQGMPQRIGSGVVVSEHIYVANADGGTIECLELATGKQCWRARVTGGPHWASTVTAGGLLYATNQSGTTRVFRPNPEHFELVAENNLRELVNATPAFAENRVFIRGAEYLYCVSD